MENLVYLKCEVCRVGAPKATVKEIEEFMQQLPHWKLTAESDVKKIERVYTFDDYTGAVNFTNRVAVLAEEEDHHPAIVLEWGKVSVTWWTHKIKGLHRNDFIMAAKSDQLYKA